MIAVGDRPSGNGSDQQVGGSEPLQAVVRVVESRDGERGPRRDRLKDGGPAEEVQVILRQGAPDLRTQVLGNVAVGAGRPAGCHRDVGLGPADHGEVEARGPTLGADGELPDDVRRQHRPGASHELDGLGLVEGEVGGSEFLQHALGPEPREREVGTGTPGKGHPKAVWETVEQHAQQIEDALVHEPVDVVQHEDRRAGPRGQAGEETWQWPGEHPLRP